MTRPYAPRGVLRHLPVSMLRQFFDKEQVPLAVAWNELHEDDADSLYETWQALPPHQRDHVEEMLRNVHDLATPHGVRLLFDETAFQHDSVPATFESIQGHFAKSFWMLLHRAPLFHDVLRIVRADQLSGRYWRTTTGLPDVALTYPQRSARELAVGLQQYFPVRQGRGQRVTAEHYFRAGRDHYFFCYPDDYTQTHTSHGPDGKLKRRPHRPVFEVVFVYTPEAGTLELYAPVDKKVRAEIEEVFCRTILDCDPPPPRTKGDPRFEWNPLFQGDTRFPTDPADGITSVAVRRVRFALPTAGERHERGRLCARDSPDASRLGRTDADRVVARRPSHSW